MMGLRIAPGAEKSLYYQINSSLPLEMADQGSVTSEAGSKILPE
jgi:hypothetical protein